MLVPYTTSKGHKIALLRHGLLSVPEMFNAEHSDIRLTTWKLRGAGVFIMYASATCLSRLLRIICMLSEIVLMFLKMPDCSLSINKFKNVIVCQLGGCDFGSTFRYINVVDVLQASVGCWTSDGIC